MERMWEKGEDAYAAVAEKISTILPLVQRHNPSENPVVNNPIAKRRFSILVSVYRTTMDPTSNMDAKTVPMTALAELRAP